MISKGLLLAGTLVSLGFALTRKKPVPVTVGPAGPVSPPMPPPPGPMPPPPQETPPFMEPPIGPGDEGPDIVPIVPPPGGSTPPFLPGGVQGLALCLDASLDEIERPAAMALLLLTVDQYAASGGGDREAFAAFLDATAAVASVNGHPQYAFCLVAKAAGVRAGFSGRPIWPSIEVGLPEWK